MKEEVDWKKVRKIAQEARHKLEKYQRRKRSMFTTDLAGLCFTGAAYITYKLQNAGYNARTQATNWHSFTHLAGKIIDVTATQFGGPKIIIASKREAKKMLSKDWQNDAIYSPLVDNTTKYDTVEVNELLAQK